MKKLKTLLTLGIVTVATATTAIPSNALSSNCITTKKCITTNKCSKHKTKGVVYLYINGKKYKFNINPSCTNKPESPNTGNNNSDTNNSTENNNNSGSNNDSVNNNTENNNNNNQSSNNNSGNSNNTNTGSNNNSENSNTGSNNNNSSSSNQESTNSFSAYQKEVVRLVNIERAKYGISPLKENNSLDNVATKKSEDMIKNNYFDHTSPTYGSPFDMMRQFGISYSTAGENIAMGQSSPQEVVNAWMNSEGHRKNILNSNFTEIGIGVAKNSKGQLYWTQMFIG